MRHRQRGKGVDRVGKKSQTADPIRMGGDQAHAQEFLVIDEVVGVLGVLARIEINAINLTLNFQQQLGEDRVAQPFRPAIIKINIRNTFPCIFFSSCQF